MKFKTALLTINYDNYDYKVKKYRIPTTKY